MRLPNGSLVRHTAFDIVGCIVGFDENGYVIEKSTPGGTSINPGYFEKLVRGGFIQKGIRPEDCEKCLYVRTCFLEVIRTGPPDASKMYPSRRHRPTNESINNDLPVGTQVRFRKGCRYSSSEPGRIAGRYKGVYLVEFDRPGMASTYVSEYFFYDAIHLGHIPAKIEDTERFIAAREVDIEPTGPPDASKMYPSRRHHRPTNESAEDKFSIGTPVRVVDPSYRRTGDVGRIVGRPDAFTEFLRGVHREGLRMEDREKCLFVPPDELELIVDYKVRHRR